MKIQTNTLNVSKFKKDFSNLYKTKSSKENEQMLECVEKLINESNRSISSFLKKVDSIEDKKMQRYCRHSAIAQMYNADLYYRGGSFVESSSYGDVFLIQLPICKEGWIPRFSTVILSKYGDILINEGEISTNSGMNYGKGFIIQKIIDGQVSRKFDIIDNAGARVLPCIFDNIEGHIGEFDIYYGQLQFDLSIYGNKNTVGRDILQKMLNNYDVYVFNCISEDSILFSLYYYEDSDTDNELMEELRTTLSPLLISKERLQEIVASK